MRSGNRTKYGSPRRMSTRHGRRCWPPERRRWDRGAGDAAHCCGVPLYGVDIRERDLPQETEQMRALNFNKGCYVGQEIVERIRSRGNVHRKFTGFLVEGTGDDRGGGKIIVGRKGSGRDHQRRFACTPPVASGRSRWDIFGAKWECRGAR